MHPAVSSVIYCAIMSPPPPPASLLQIAGIQFIIPDNSGGPSAPLPEQHAGGDDS